MGTKGYFTSIVTIFLLIISSFAFAAGKPEIISHTVQYLDRALSVNVQWQSENPVTKVKVVAGQGEKELKIDEYDNRRNPSGYEGEVSVVIQMEPNILQSAVPYQIQLEDDLRQKSALFTGKTTPPPGAVIGGVMGGSGVGVGIGVGVGGAPGIGIGMGVGGVGGVMAGQPTGNDDGWGKDHIKAGRGQGETHDGKSNDMVDKLLKVAERFDTPPSLDVIKVSVLGPENVSFSSKANDDKGIRDITFRVYDSVGNKAGEQILNNLGKKWEGSTQPIKLTAGGSYRVVAQAVDTAGNTSKEQVATFAVKGTPPPTTLVVTLTPQETIAIGALWQLDGGEWQQSAASVATTPGKHKLVFKDAAGWVSPAAQDFEVKEGPNTAVGTYTLPAAKEGKLTVTILPADAVKAGAQWQADGGAWQTSGASIMLKQGKHSITFKDVTGWVNAQPLEIDIKEGDNSASGTYTVIPAKTGKLLVTTLPAAISNAGAQWQVDGGAWQAGGTAITVTIGQHTVTFKDVAGWSTPPVQTVDIKEGENNATGTYTQKSGTLSVSMLPADISATAQWSADGGVLQKSGATISLPIGTHSIKFSDLTGWTTPQTQTITIKEGANSATGTYSAQNGVLVVTIAPATAASAGAQWRVGTAAWQNSGASISIPAGTLSIEFKDVAGWSKPANLAVTVSAAKTTTTGAGYGKIFTSNADFETGQLVGLEDQTVKDQLQLSKSSSTLPFIWVPNSSNGTISKVNSATGEELGRYPTGSSTGGSPSRTTVDLKGNCWVGNRNTGTVVKVGLSENGQCIDRNNNGKIETSTGGTALPWGTDECVLFEVSLGANSGPRGLAIDRNNNIWVGTYSTQKLYYIDGSNGTILKTIDTSSKSHGSYGAVIDQNGIVWSADISNQNVLRLDPATGTISNIPLGHMAYGIGLDKAGHLFVAGWTHNKLTRINTITGQKEWTKDSNAYGLRGVAVTNEGDVWVANSYSNTVTRWSNDGTIKATVSGFSHPTGVAVDADGKVWCVDNGSQNVHRINPATNQIEMTKSIGGSGHYGYSDMTGIVARSMTTKLGTWTATFDGGTTTNWNTVFWNGQESANAVIKVRARVSSDAKAWSVWEDVLKSTPLKNAVTGRFIQLESTMQLVTGEKSPVLTDLTITAKP